MPKVSVIVPVYNAEKELNAAIDSIINQSLGFENIELIIVDDCSTDGSQEIIKLYAYNPKVKIYLLILSDVPRAMYSPQLLNRFVIFIKFYILFKK